MIRTLRRCWRRAACALFVATIAVPSEAAWHRFDSPNFVVMGDASPRQLRDVAVKFEAFREVLGRLRGNAVATAPVPTVILVFRSAKAFTPYAPRYKGRAQELAGLFVPERDANHIALVDDGEGDAAAVMYHEYAHVLLSNGAGQIPVWLNEGLAEVYSTFELSHDRREAKIGRAIEGHLARLNRDRLLSLPELLQVDHSSPLYNEGERRSVFYAQSWALVHMITFSEPSRTPQLRAYLQRLSAGVGAAEAWKEAFGDDRIERDLAWYVSRAIYRSLQVKFSEKISQLPATARPVSPADVHGYLAHFLLAQERLDEAAGELAAGAKLDPQNATVRVLSAHLDVARGDHAKAIERLRAVGDVEDWLVAYHAGVALCEAMDRTQDSRAELATAAGRFFDGATRHRSFPNAVIRRAAMEIAPDHVPTDATLLAVQGARTAAPGREDYAFVHAQLHALRSDFRAARTIMGPLMSSASEPRVREAARSLMKWIVTLEQHRAASAAAEATRQAQPSSATSASDGAETSVQRFEPVFRNLKDDEERIDGLLERIECSVRGAAVFVVKAADRTMHLPARKMADVEFITYRDDLTGNVSCGPLKEPMRVYVTSRGPSKPDGPRAVVAVEFLPKEMQ